MKCRGEREGDALYRGKILSWLLINCVADSPFPPPRRCLFVVLFISFTSFLKLFSPTHCIFSFLPQTRSHLPLAVFLLYIIIIISSYLHYYSFGSFMLSVRCSSFIIFILLHSFCRFLPSLPFPFQSLHLASLLFALASLRYPSFTFSFTH